MRVYNTLTRSLEPLQTREPGRVGLYVCGITVYDYCHIGHARAMMAFDVVVRHLRHSGLEVDFVRNHTDVDDKIINRARETGESPLALSARFVAELERDFEALGLVAPTHAPQVTRYIPQIVAMIDALVRKGNAYRADNGDVYFAVETFPGYGKLSGKKLEDLRAGERVAVEAAKRHPADFALWKAAGPDDLGWDSPFGKGRPGWHIECSAMATELLGPCFDIHGGGIDLVFPHHENEIAQSECANGCAPFARYWLHNGHLTLAHEKMSKSLGNIVRIRDIVREVPGEALRLLYLKTHYRSPLPYSSEGLTEALTALDRVYLAKETALEVTARGGGVPVDQLGDHGREVHRLATAFPDRFDAAMDDDFNSAEALGALFELVTAVNRFGNDKKASARGAQALAPAVAAFDRAAQVLGLAALVPAAYFDDVKHKRLAAMGRDAGEIDARLAARTAARSARDWARADAIRDELDAMGIVVMDAADGSTWRMKVV